MAEHVRKRSMTSAEILSAFRAQQRSVIWPMYPLAPGTDVLDCMSVKVDDSGGAGATGIYEFAEQHGEHPKRLLGYEPSKDDWALLKRRYNALYERRPPWEIIVQDLLRAGHAPSEAGKYLVQCPYSVLWVLDEVRKLDAAQPAQDVKAAAVVTQADKPELDDAARLRVRVGGKWYDISDEAMRMLRILFKAEGAWVQGSTISKENRPDKTRKRMPAAVSAIIESHKRHGYRIPSLLPR